MQQIPFGPIFGPTTLTSTNHTGVSPLRLHIEWAGPNTFGQIPLFRRDSGQTGGTMRLEELVFDRKELPFDLECFEYQVTRIPHAVFLPLDSLLAALYGRFDVRRSVCQVLSELASTVLLNYPVRRLITVHGLLAPEVEAAGFRLNTVLREGRSIFANIAWQADSRASRFHTCVCKFEMSKTGAPNEGTWQPVVIPGVAQLLTGELRQLSPSAPRKLFSPAGLIFLQAQLHQLVTRMAEDKTPPNKKAYEQSC